MLTLVAWAWQVRFLPVEVKVAQGDTLGVSGEHSAHDLEKARQPVKLLGWSTP